MCEQILRDEIQAIVARAAPANGAHDRRSAQPRAQLRLHIRRIDGVEEMRRADEGDINGIGLLEDLVADPRIRAVAPALDGIGLCARRQQIFSHDDGQREQREQQQRERRRRSG